MSSGILRQVVSGRDVPVTELNMHSALVNVASSPGSAMLYPIIVAADGSPTSSRTLTWRLHIEQPFTYVHSVQFWLEPFTVPYGWDLRVGVSASPNPADVAQGRPVAEFMAKTDLDADPATFNLMPGYSTMDYPLASTPNNPVAEQFAGQYVHMWARADGDAPAGPLLGYGAGSAPNPMTVRFSWVEL